MAQQPDSAPRLAATLVRSWRQRGTLAWLLLPLTLLYQALVGVRRCLFAIGLWRCERADCTVLVVGNTIVGGAGKTPTVIAVVQHLQRRNIAVGVVSRGYGRNTHATMAVGPTSAAADVGDEPLLIARATNAPVFVGRQRMAAARALCAAYPQVQVIVCDDGLQHYRLYRDLEICVFDNRGIGNGWMLPSGPLREPWPRRLLHRCGQSAATTLVLHTGSQPTFAGYRAQRALAPYALRADGARVPLATLAANAATRPVLALAGIAQPDQFFNMLQDAGLTPGNTLALPDHCDFAQLDTRAWQEQQVVCTEKDAVKLWHVVPDALAVPLLQTIDHAFFAQLDTLLAPLLAARLSSRHGHQTA